MYLDYTGGDLFASCQSREHMGLLESGVLGNAHSTNPTSAASTELVERARASVLEFFTASPDKYVAIFTPNATSRSSANKTRLDQAAAIFEPDRRPISSAYSPRRLSYPNGDGGTAIWPGSTTSIRGRRSCPPPPEIDNQTSDARPTDDADPRRNPHCSHEKEPSKSTDPGTRDMIPVRSGPTDPHRRPLDDRLARGHPRTRLVRVHISPLRLKHEQQ